MDQVITTARKYTSVSLRRESFKALKQARARLSRRGCILSDQQIFRVLLHTYLQKWRGVGRRSNTLRRYNAKGLGYVIKPLYLDFGSVAAIWARAAHSGISVSRMLDFAIRHYLQAFVQEHLSPGRSAADLHLGIDFECDTQINSHGILAYSQKIGFHQPPAMPP